MKFAHLLDQSTYTLTEVDQRLNEAHRQGWEQAKEASQQTIQQLEAMNKALMEQLAKGVSMQPAPIMIADVMAHRLGWEQCRAEAQSIAGSYYEEPNGCGNSCRVNISCAIAAMEYKEATNEG